MIPTTRGIGMCGGVCNSLDRVATENFRRPEGATAHGAMGFGTGYGSLGECPCGGA